MANPSKRMSSAYHDHLEQLLADIISLGLAAAATEESNAQADKNGWPGVVLSAAAGAAATGGRLRLVV